MGEATYYMKLALPSTADDKEQERLLTEVSDFMKEGARAYDFWQDNRGRKPEDFWPEFEKKFPRVTAMLGPLVGYDCNNALAGELDFGSVEDVDGMHLRKDAAGVYSIGYAATVWHFAVWDRMLEYIEKTYGLSGTYVSDEYVDILELL